MGSNESSFEREYQALKAGTAVVELADWSSIAVTGADRQAFLHNFCTNDVKRLVPGASCEAFFTNVKGKIVGHGLLCCRDKEIAFVGVPRQGAMLARHLDRYVIREDVTLRDTTEERSYLLVVGGVHAGDSDLAVSWNIIGRPDSELFEVEPGKVSDVVSRLVADGFVSVGPQAFETTRIEAGMPRCGIDFNEENLPQEIGRDALAISFTKGCYLGQETVARIDALGHVNQRLVGVRFLGNAVPTCDTKLTHDGRSVGVVKSAAFSPKLNAPIALAMVRREANSPGAQLASPIGECEVVTLPMA